MLLFKTIIFTIAAPGTITIVIPYWLLSLSESAPKQLGVARYLGVAPLLAGAGIYLWCAWDFTFTGRGTPAPMDPPKTLVARGLYRYVRNPMYVGILSILVGETILFTSSNLLIYTVIVFTYFFLFILIYEEPTLERKFGEGYRDYRRKVPRWIPRKPANN